MLTAVPSHEWVLAEVVACFGSKEPGPFPERYLDRGTHSSLLMAFPGTGNKGVRPTDGTAREHTRLLHFLLIHVLTIPFAYLRYGRIAFLLDPLPSFGGPGERYPADFGLRAHFEKTPLFPVPGNAISNEPGAPLSR